MPESVRYGKLTLRCEMRGEAKFLFIILPSGHPLSYPFITWIHNKFDLPAIQFMDNAELHGGWSPCNHGTGAYGGLWVENCVQGIARDLLAAAITRLEAAGYPVVLHVHDEVICEVPLNGAHTVTEFQALVNQLPEWASPRRVSRGRGRMTQFCAPAASATCIARTIAYLGKSLPGWCSHSAT
jgi:hypothetical protein